MPVTRMRRGVFYVMVGTLIALLLANAVTAALVLDARSDQGQTRDNLSIGCDRANRTREALHYLAVTRDDVPGRIVAGLNLTPREKPQANRPWLVDCDAAYP